GARHHRHDGSHGRAARGDRPPRRRRARRHVPRHPALLRRARADREQRRVSGDAPPALPRRDQGGGDRIGARRRTADRGRVRPQDDLLRRAAQLRRARQGAAGRQGRLMSELARRRVIKKIDGGHGHHGGAWKVAYADFVTAMMALFMVMWLLASTDTESRKEISAYFRTGILPEGDLAMNRAAQFAPSVIEAAPAPPPPGEESIDDSTA